MCYMLLVVFEQWRSGKSGSMIEERVSTQTNEMFSKGIGAEATCAHLLTSKQQCSVACWFFQ